MANLVVLDPDPSSAASRALMGNGAEVTTVTQPAGLQAAIGSSAGPVDGVVIVADTDSPLAQEGLKTLFGQPRSASLPVVLVGNGALDPKFLKAFRTGVVDHAGKPLEPGRVGALLQELAQRPDAFHGRSDKRELTMFLQHVKSTQRSGVLTVNPKRPNEGTASYVRGQLESAKIQERTGHDALLTMLAGGLLNWTFTALSGGGQEVVLEVAAEDDSVGIDIEVGEGDDGELEVPIEGVPLEDAQGSASARLLLVDDDPDLRRMFSLVLSKRGFQVDSATDGVDGFERARTGGYDLIVADLSMPRMDGWGLLRKLRDDHVTRELPVAFLSCHDNYRESLKAMDAGAQAYLSKSVRHDALATQIRELLGPREQVLAELAKGSGRTGQIKLDRVGVQWLLRQLAEKKVSGRLSAKDAWASYHLFVREGRPVHAVAQAGAHSAEGVRAFNALVASRSAEGAFLLGEDAPSETLSAPTDALIADAVRLLNENEEKVRETLLVKARTITVNPDLYTLYLQVSAQTNLETAKLICEDRLTPAEVIAKSDVSPLEVEETLKDLVRRGVVTLAG